MHLILQDALVKYRNETRVIYGELKQDRNGCYYFKTRTMSPADELSHKLDPKEVIDQTPANSTSRLYLTYYR